MNSQHRWPVCTERWVAELTTRLWSCNACSSAGVEHGSLALNYHPGNALNASKQGVQNNYWCSNTYGVAQAQASPQSSFRRDSIQHMHY